MREPVLPAPDAMTDSDDKLSLAPTEELAQEDADVGIMT